MTKPDEELEDKGLDAVSPEKESEPELMDVLKSVLSTMTDLSKRVTDMENGGANKFKDAPVAKEVADAKALRTRGNLDPKISQIVDEMLGEDFGAEVVGLGDRPGYVFSLLVPPRLSDTVRDKRPVKEIDENGNYTGSYVKDKQGNVVYEDYMPEDRRSRTLSSADSYDAIRSHCEKVRGYIVQYFTKMSRPIPEFKVKS